MRIGGNGRGDQDQRSHGQRWRLVVGPALVAALLLVGCGSSDEGSDEASATTPTTVPVPVILDQAQLNGLLLTVGDLPPGWVLTPPEASTGSSTDTLCPDGQATVESEQHPTVETSFAQGETGPFVYQALSSAEDAEAHFADVTQAFDSCLGQTWTEDMDGSPMDVSLNQVSSVQVGDETAAYRLSGSSSEAEVALTADFVLVLNGTVVELYSGISVTSPYLSTEQLDPEQFSTIIETANDKVTNEIDAI